MARDDDGMDELSGQSDLMGLYDARRRIVAAFERVAAAAEAQVLAAPDPAELERLRRDYEDERTANAQLEERVRVLKARGGDRDQELEAENAALRAALADLRAAREAERAELDDVLGRLIPLVEEAR